MSELVICCDGRKLVEVWGNLSGKMCQLTCITWRFEKTVLSSDLLEVSVQLIKIQDVSSLVIICFLCFLDFNDPGVLRVQPNFRC